MKLKTKYLQEWVGHVEQINNNSFVGHLKDITNGGTDEETEIPFDKLSGSEIKTLQIGLIFSLKLADDGKIELKFKKTKKISKSKTQKAQKWVEDIIKSKTFE